MLNQIVSNISNIASEFIYHVKEVNSLEAATSNSRGGVLSSQSSWHDISIFGPALTMFHADPQSWRSTALTAVFTWMFDKYLSAPRTLQAGEHKRSQGTLGLLPPESSIIQCVHWISNQHEDCSLRISDCNLCIIYSKNRTDERRQLPSLKRISNVEVRILWAHADFATFCFIPLV